MSMVIAQIVKPSRRDQELATIKKRRTPIITGTLSGTIGRFSKKTDFGGSC
jgi:hypothetical protein